MQSNQKPPDITISQQMLASCTGAFITSIFVTPLDVVKIRIQAQQKEFMKNKCFLYCNGLMDHICYCNGSSSGQISQNGAKQWFKRPVYFKGTFDGIFQIARTEGITSLWSGLPPTLVMALPATVVYFTIYDEIRQQLNFRLKHDRQPLWVPMLSGGSARILSAFLISPLEMIRTKMQSQRLSYTQMADAIRQSLRAEGVAGLYKGLTATILRDVPFSCLYWAGYESMKKHFGAHDEPTFAVSFVSGAISGAFAAMVTLPFDVVKTHKQIELGENLVTTQAHRPQNTREILASIYRKSGIRGLFAGLSPRMIKVVPACAIMISTYEFGKSFFKHYNATRHETSAN